MIFPIPKKEEYKDGVYKLKEYTDTIELIRLFEFYKNGNSDLIYKNVALFDKEEYKITINENGIVIECSTEEGKFRAISSLRQLLKEHKANLPFAEIWDKPDYKRRNYMLDISRCRIPKVSVIEKYIDLIADLKYNEFQLYFENFCFKFPLLPEYTKDFDCLTPDDIMHLDKYCKERFIDFQANQNCFGHMETWLKQKEFEHLEVGYSKGEKTGTINILNPETTELIEKLFDSVLPYYTSEYVNIGMDEALGLGKFELEEICKERGNARVFMDYLNQIADFIKRKYGKKVMFWADMVHSAKEEFHLIPEGAIALNWGYAERKTMVMENISIGLKERNVPYYVCPGTNTWITITGRYDLMHFNVQNCAEMGMRHGADGYMLTDWGCGEGHMHNPIQALPAIALAGQYAWNVGGGQSGGNFKHPFKNAAHKYINDYFFGGVDVCEHIYRMQQYYLLEPERTHNCTMTGYMIRQPIFETEAPGCFSIKGKEPFYFENIEHYTEKEIAIVEKIDFDKNWKSQFMVNAKMVLFSAKLCKIRLGYMPDNDEIDSMIALCDEIIKEHTEVWMRLNFEEGIDFFRSQLYDRRAELLELKK